MGLFKKKIDMTYKPVFKAKALQEQYDKLKEAYKKLENKYESALNYNDYYVQAMETVKKQREFILELQDKIAVLQEELIAKNKIIQGMDNANK